MFTKYIVAWIVNHSVTTTSMSPEAVTFSGVSVYVLYSLLHSKASLLNLKVVRL